MSFLLAILDFLYGIVLGAEFRLEAGLLAE